MSRQYTGKQIKRTAEVKQKNGDVYVYERIYQYDRDKKKTVVVSNRLIGKRRAGETEIVPTRGSRESSGPQPEPSAAGILPEEDVPAVPADLQQDPDGVKTILEDELRAYALEQSCLQEAAELCLPESSGGPLLSRLWAAMLDRETRGMAAADMDLREMMHQAHGLSETLLRLRLLQNKEDKLTLLAVSGEPGRLFFRGSSCLLGAQKLPEMLSVPAGVESVCSQLGGSDLVLQRIYLDVPALDGDGIRDLQRRTFDFVCPLSLQAQGSQRLLAETALTRRESAVFLEAQQAWAATFPLELGQTLEITGKTGAELFLHVYSFPARRDAESAHFEERLERLRLLLESGTAPADLDAAAQDLRRRFLREGEDGSWSTDPEACRRHLEQLGCLLLVSNGERDAEEALRLHQEAAERRRWLEQLELDGRSPGAELMITMLCEALQELVREAREESDGAGSGLGAKLVSEAAAAYLYNATLGEILSMLLGPQPAAEAAQVRRAAVSERLRRAMDSKKAASGS